MGQKVVYQRLDEDFGEAIDEDVELTPEEVEELAAWEEQAEVGV